MSHALDYIDRLRSAGTKADALNALWDLRDLAYDQPAVWHGFSAEALFQALAEEVDSAATDAIDWDAFATLLAATLTATTRPSDPKTS